MNQYIFDNKSEEREFQRLQLVEAANDPTTIRLLEETGIQPGWHCLEVGAGAGSILRWMGSQVGPTGLAVGVDKKTAYLHKVDSPPVRIYKGSFLDVPLEQSFDLLHSRYVLIHNQEERAILEKMYSLLKPGGWALLKNRTSPRRHCQNQSIRPPGKGEPSHVPDVHQSRIRSGLCPPASAQTARSRIPYRQSSIPYASLSWKFANG